MKLTLTLKSTNAAFATQSEDNEAARILRELADRIENTSCREGKLYDVNGNSVGHWAIK